MKAVYQTKCLLEQLKTRKSDLSSGDGAGDLSSVSTHHFAKSSNDIRGQGEAAIIS